MRHVGWILSRLLTAALLFTFAERAEGTAILGSWSHDAIIVAADSRLMDRYVTATGYFDTFKVICKFTQVKNVFLVDSGVTGPGFDPVQIARTELSKPGPLDPKVESFGESALHAYREMMTVAPPPTGSPTGLMYLIAGIEQGQLVAHQSSVPSGVVTAGTKVTRIAFPRVSDVYGTVALMKLGEFGEINRFLAKHKGWGLQLKPMTARYASRARHRYYRRLGRRLGALIRIQAKVTPTVAMPVDILLIEKDRTQWLDRASGSVCPQISRIDPGPRS